MSSTSCNHVSMVACNLETLQQPMIESQNISYWKCLLQQLFLSMIVEEEQKSLAASSQHQRKHLEVETKVNQYKIKIAGLLILLFCIILLYYSGFLRTQYPPEMRGNITLPQFKLANSLWKIPQYRLNLEGKFIDSSYALSIPDNLKIAIISQKQYYEQKYQTSKYMADPLTFCIVVPSFNSAESYRRNMNSIFQQDYPSDKYHVVYVDDASKDLTPDYVQKYTELMSEERFQLVRNKQNRKALFNIHNAAHNYCRQKEVMIVVDGDDELLGTHVLKLYNAVYQKTKMYVVYSNYLRKNPEGVKVGTSFAFPDEVKQSRDYREAGWGCSHLRSYYVDMFRKIKKEDLMDSRGNWWQEATDHAAMMPILEMAGDKVLYIPELTYVYYADKPNNNIRIKWDKLQKTAKEIKSLPKYGQVTLDFVANDAN